MLEKTINKNYVDFSMGRNLVFFLILWIENKIYTIHTRFYE